MGWGGVGWGGVVWCGVAWCGVVWCGVVWCGVVWCGVVWCGVVWCGVLWYSKLIRFAIRLCSSSDNAHIADAVSLSLVSEHVINAFRAGTVLILAVAWVHAVNVLAVTWVDHLVVRV